MTSPKLLPADSSHCLVHREHRRPEARTCSRPKTRERTRARTRVKAQDQGRTKTRARAMASTRKDQDLSLLLSDLSGASAVCCLLRIFYHLLTIKKAGSVETVCLSV